LAAILSSESRLADAATELTAASAAAAAGTTFCEFSRWSYAQLKSLGVTKVIVDGKEPVTLGQVQWKVFG